MHGPIIFNPPNKLGWGAAIIPTWETRPESHRDWEVEAGFEPRQPGSRDQAYNHHAVFSPEPFSSTLRKYNDS